MKLRNLALVVALLIAASVAVWFANRPDRHGPDRDPRVGQPLAKAAVLADAAGFTLTDGGQSVKLVRADDAWTVADYHDLPADFSKLTRLVQDLLSTKIDRFVTATPEKIERLGFGDTRIEFTNTDGAVLWAADLGRTADGGGRFLRFDGAPEAYLARLDTWLDPVAKNWADSALLDLKPADIARVELTFPEGDPVAVSRETAEAAFSADATPEGKELKTATITSLLNTLAGLRFTDTAATDAPDAVAAKAYARTVTLTTFDNQTVTIALGRRPAPPPEETENAADAEDAEDAPAQPAPQPGPVFAFITHSDASSPINALMQKRAFQVGEFTHTNLPADRDALFQEN